MATGENCLSSSQISKMDNERLVRPKVQLHTLLKDAGADKDVFTMKEIMFYLGKYIMGKELYDKQQQHIVHCGNDALGAVLGVASFSVKEPRALFAMISKNLIAVNIPESQSTFKERRAPSDADRGPEETNPRSTTSTLQPQQQQQYRRRRTSDPTSLSVEEESSEPRKRHKSDSISLTFDDSLSWCVIGGLHRERGSSETSASHSNSDVGRSCNDESDDGDDSDSDNFSVEFEVESMDSDAYSENDEESVPGEDEVYEVTIIAEDEDSFDEDTETTEEDYWKCAKCEELNPPLPRHCKSCWAVRPGWLPDTCSAYEKPSNDTQTDTQADAACTNTDLEAKVVCSESPTPTLDLDDGVDVPDGKSSRSQATSCTNSQESSLCHSQPSTSSSQEEIPALERTTSSSTTESCLSVSCLEPCVICQSRPKNGCIVHGRTGHLMACYTCAKKLKKRNKLCPVCRQPIQSVILTYFS